MLAEAVTRTAVSGDWLTPLDATFLHIEDPVSHMHIGAVALMEGPPPRYEQVSRMIGSKLDLVPRLRHVVRRVPLDLGYPMWSDDHHFRLEHHVRHTALTPGGDAATADLESWVGDLMSRPLDRSRPLWEIWMVEGLAQRAWAVVLKAHHCMVDGVSASNLLGIVLDSSPDPPEAALSEPTRSEATRSEATLSEPTLSEATLSETAVSEAAVSHWVPAPGPSSWDLVRRGLSGLTDGPVRLLRSALSYSLVTPPAPDEVADLLGSFSSVSESARVPTGTILNGPIGPDRVWGTATVEVAQVKRVRRGLGGTFNDVALAAISNGFRELLLAQGQPVDLPLRSAIPISRAPRDGRGMAVGDGAFANRVSLLFGELPVHLSDTPSMLSRIAARMSDVKAANEASAVDSMIGAFEFAPAPLWALAGRLGTRVSQRTVNTVTTNVPGPQMPLYVAGRRMLKLFPYVPIALGIRVGVAILSYDGTVGFGVTADRESVPDVGALCRGITAGMKELLVAEKEASGLQDGSDPAAAAGT